MPLSQGRVVRALGVLGIGIIVLLGGRPAPAYWVAMENGIPIAWTANSTPSIWNNSTHTLAWSFDPIGFNQTGWPTMAQAGAAFQNAFQSLQDVGGTGLNFIRLPNSTGTPQSGDGSLQVCLTPNATLDYFHQNITNEAAVTYITYDVASGSLLDADIGVNGGPSAQFSNWSTLGPSAPSGFLDLETTALRQAMSALGASTTPFFSAAAWPLLRSPGDPFHDRCLSPDDRMYARTIAPATPSFSTITGTVTVQGSLAPCNLAIVVATDGDGVPQATTVTHADGTYTLNIPSATRDTPPLTNYSVTAHHYLNGTYASPTSVDLGFSGATGFIAVQPPGPVDTRGGLSGINFTVTAGTPTLTLLQQSISPSPLATQVLVLDPNGPTSGTLQFSFQNSGAFASLSNLSLGPGITLGTPTVTSTGSSQTLVTVTYGFATPPPPVLPGLRNLSFSIPGGEQFFLPAVVEVVAQGGLTALAGPQNPSAQNPTNGQSEVPLLQVTLTAAGGEDLRIRQLSFSLSGQGAVPSAVHLWNDRGSVPGIYDTGDVPILTGNAYSQSQVGETIVPSGATATVTYDNLALTIPGGASITLLFTADMPSAGTGSYTATLDPTTTGSIVAQGMFWGDGITAGGSAVTGGLVTLGSVSVGGLGQFHTSDSSVIPVGGFTTDTQITVQGTVASPSGQVGMEVEAKPIGVVFDGTGTQIQAATAPSGSIVSVDLTGLSTGTAYHWRARGLSSTGLSSVWVSFGNNAESATDFAVDQSTVFIPTALSQTTTTGIPVPAGGSAESGIFLYALAGTDTLGYLVRVEFEVQPSGAPFTNLPSALGPFGAGGTQAGIRYPGTSGTYQWQARTVSVFGASSAWTPMSGTTDDFTLTAPPVSNSKGGCIASIDAPLAGGIRWILIAGGLLLLLLLSPRWKRAGAALGALLLAGALARADSDLPLPRSLLEIPSEASRLSDLEEKPEEAPELDDLLQDNPPKAVDSPFSFNAYAGALFVDTRFSALGKDHVEHEIRGNGQMLLGIEGLYSLNDQWQIGLGAQGSLWRDVRTLAVGPVAVWRFAHSKDTTASGRFRWDHALRAQIAYETFTDTKSGFGNFNGTVGAALGYEFRLNLVRHYSLTIGADLQYAQWTYAPGVLSGDTTVGGLGGFFYVGVAFLP
ncbi:MAG TPA: hypothetical protein VMU54_10765 [Planctomycetota bacterium]|nr:hypothetical protein [Planctomycetota bacterium]